MGLNFPSLMIYGDSQLGWLLPEVRLAYIKTRADAARIGIVIKVADFGGVRTPSITEQLITWRDEAVKRGEPSYRVSPFDKGKHGVGGAIDFKVVSRPSDMTMDQAYAKVGAIARTHGLLWGGNFSAPRDIFHLESQQTRAQLEARWNVWKQSPGFPKMGATEWAVLFGVAVVLAAVIFYIRSHGVPHV